MKKAFFVLLILAGAWLVISLARPSPYTTLSGETMGTTYLIRIADRLATGSEQQWETRIQNCLDDINARMSTYRADSEVCCFNRCPSTDWYPVSRDTVDVVAASLHVSEQTHGAFDITVGPLVNLWSFGPDHRPAGIPSDAEIEAALACVGYRRLSVRLDPPALRKEIPELAIDLSAIAKGFAVDRVAETLDAGGISAYMVEIGGEVRTRGSKGNGQSWRIGLERPAVGQRIVESVVALQDQCLATSGDYRNVFEWEGQLYSHEIDPRTGRPAQHGVAAVSVLSTSTMWADAYATGLMIMPPEEAWRLAQEIGLDIMLVVHQQQGFQRRMTPGFADAVAEEVK